MQLACPQCGTRDIRVSQRQDFSEMLKALVGIYPLRCRRCRFRWLTSTWASGAWRYARCPRCYRQELTTWSEQYYRPPLWTVMLLRSGATPYRCAACRCNFASFRKCKERFSWRHETKQEPLPRVSPGMRVEKSEPPPAAEPPATEKPAPTVAGPAPAVTSNGPSVALNGPAAAPTTPAGDLTPRALVNGQRPVPIPRAPAKPQPKPAERLIAPVPPAPPNAILDEPEDNLL